MAPRNRGLCKKKSFRNLPAAHLTSGANPDSPRGRKRVQKEDRPRKAKRPKLDRPAYDTDQSASDVADSESQASARMPTLLDTCKSLFKTESLYEVLGVSKTASAKEVKKGYHKVSLSVHPDRVPDAIKAAATEKFQTLGRVYAILSDKDKRAAYDENGYVDEEDGAPMDRDWVDYWRLLFKKITKKDVEDFEKSYRGSEEEKEAVRQAYEDTKGDIRQMLKRVMCATLDDEDRFRAIIQEMIDTGELSVLSKWGISKVTKKDKDKAKKEAVEASKLAKNAEQASLSALIQKNQSSRAARMDSLLDSLAARYGGDDGGDPLEATTSGAKKTRKTSAGSRKKGKMSKS